MKSLRELPLKRVYESRSPQTDLIDDFYIPALGASVNYDRLTFSFTSGALRAAALGIAGFIENSGLMRLIAAPRLENRDKEIIQAAGRDPNALKEFEDSIVGKIRNIHQLASAIDKRYVDALGWMLREKMLDLRLAVPIALSEDEQGGIFHTKLGILSDFRGDGISFSGSINETYGGWNRNVERFKVYRSWEPTQLEDFSFDQETFANYWNEPEAHGIKFVPITEAIVTEFSKGAPRRPDLEDLRRIESSSANAISVSVKPRDYQEEAIREWKANGRHGILSMATGSGKTFTATLAVDDLLDEQSPLATFVLVPNASIGDQWVVAFERLPIKTVNLSDSANWKKKLEESVNDLSLGVDKHLVIISVMNRAGSEAFLSKVEELSNSGFKTFLIADEAHRFGANKVRAALSENYTYRLGLSATPKRYFDDEGTDFLLNYFRGSVYEFSIGDALNWKPSPGQNPILTPFEYKPVFVQLTEDELSRYMELTSEIVRKSNHLNGPDREEVAQQIFELQLARARVKKSASQKIPALRLELTGRKNLTHAIIYCEDSHQMGDVFSVLRELGIVSAPFTQEQGTKPEDRFRGRSEREEILRLFREGDLQVLVSMSLLDEGVDIPEAQTGFILASSGNAKEFVQRTGRLVRWHKNKALAHIVDFLVAPEAGLSSSDSKQLSKTESNLIESELNRMEEYVEPALNRLEILTILTKIRTAISQLAQKDDDSDDNL